MAGITFSEVEVKRLILALAGSKAVPVGEPEDDDKPEEKLEKPDSEEKPEMKTEESAGKPFGKDASSESTKAMLERKLKEK